jgi:gamma-glutamylcysteine synthetase
MIFTHFYHDKTKSLVLELFENLSHHELITLQIEVIKKGFGAQFREKKLLDILLMLLSLAKDGLADMGIKNSLQYIDPFRRLLEKKHTCTQWAQNNFHTINKENLNRLIKPLAPLAKPFI